MSGPAWPPDVTPAQNEAKIVADAVENSGGGVWPSVDPKDLAESIRQRILNWALINQATTPYCGPAAIATDLARSNPVLYAQTIANLYKTGSANMPGPGFDGHVLTTTHELRQVDYTTIYPVRGPTNQPAADWILMSSIRNCESWRHYYWGTRWWTGGYISGITLPSTFEKWLHGFGYSKVLNVTNLLRTKDMDTLKDASDFLGWGWSVFLLLNHKVLNGSTEESYYPDHYAPLASRVSFHWMMGGEDCHVYLACLSWGRFCRVPADGNRPMTGKEFRKNFYGYVAAKH